MKRDEILEAWITEKIYLVEGVSAMVGYIIENEDIADKEPSCYFLTGYYCSDGCTSWKEYVEKHPPTVKPFHYNLIPFDETDLTSIKIIGYNADSVRHLLNLVELSSIDIDDFKAIEESVTILKERLDFFWGYQARGFRAKEPYINGPGAASREAGKWTMDKAYDVLEKYGGYPGYKALPHGEKKAVREEIEKAIKAKDARNVHNIINKFGALKVPYRKEK